jgi:hypothetical protein
MGTESNTICCGCRYDPNPDSDLPRSPRVPFSLCVIAIKILSDGNPHKIPGWVPFFQFDTPLFRGSAFQEGNIIDHAGGRDQWSLRLVLAVESTTTGRVV